MYNAVIFQLAVVFCGSFLTFFVIYVQIAFTDVFASSVCGFVVVMEVVIS